MKRESIIKPDVLNILCRDPRPRQRVVHEAIQMPEPTPEPKKSFWGKVGEFFKQAASLVKPILTPIAAVLVGAAALLNAVVRFKDLSNEESSEESTESSSKKFHKKSRPYAVGAVKISILKPTDGTCYSPVLQGVQEIIYITRPIPPEMWDN